MGWVGGTLEMIFFQFPAVGRDMLSWTGLLKIPPSLALSTSGMGQGMHSLYQHSTGAGKQGLWNQGGHHVALVEGDL